jgi:outer membrane protein TolC
MGRETYIRTLLAANIGLQRQLLETEIAARQTAAEKGIYDPVFNLSARYQKENRPNTVEQRRSLQGESEFDETSQRYAASLDFLTPLGTEVGFTTFLRRLVNNLQDDDPLEDIDAEYVTFSGLTLSQPLLKGAGRRATEAALVVARQQQESALDAYREELMRLIATAELAYLTVYQAQEQRDFFQQSRDFAEKIRQQRDQEVREGRLPALQLRAAEAALADRRARLIEAQQKLTEASNEALLLLARPGGIDGVVLVADSPPAGEGNPAEAASLLEKARAANPVFRQRVKAADMAATRLDYARNQALPELNVVGRAGYNGLGESTGSSFDDIYDRHFPEWYVGVELTVPLGNARGRNQVAAAELRKRQADLTVAELGVQLASQLDTAVRQVVSTRESYRSLMTTAQLNREVLDANTEVFNAGKIGLREVLLLEEDLADAQLKALQGRLAHRQAELKVKVLTGTLLEDYGLEVDMAGLAALVAKFQDTDEAANQ